jgi:hypothetical protein
VGSRYVGRVDALKSIVISLFHQLYHFDTIQEYHVTFSLNHIRDFRTRGDKVSHITYHMSHALAGTWDAVDMKLQHRVTGRFSVRHRPSSE